MLFFYTHIFIETGALAYNLKIIIATDDYGTIYVDGKLMLTTNVSCKPYSFTLDSGSRILAIKVVNSQNKRMGFGFIGLILESSDEAILSDKSWKCVSNPPSSPAWVQYDFDDNSWPTASCYAVNGDWYTKGVLSENAFKSVKACWIGHSTTLLNLDALLFCRKAYKLNA